jgi:26S proteasome regulatory subunit N3
VSLLEKSVATKELRFIGRALRALSLRKKLTTDILRELINQTFMEDETTPQKQLLFVFLDKVKSKEASSTASATSMETEPTTATASAPAKERKPKALIPEVEAFVHLLVTIFLLDNKYYEEVIVAFNTLTMQ